VTTLLERERELAAVEALLERGSGVLVIEGAAGIGKTALVEAACSRAAGRGDLVLRARGSELEAGFPFAVVRQLFERYLAGAGPAERGALLAGPAATVRSFLLGDVAAGQAADRSFSVLHGLYWLAANVAARRPLLLAVDDAHWADEPSLRWLAYAAPRLEGLEIALIVALRQSEPGSATAPLSAMRAEASAIRPRLLSVAAVNAVVRGAIGDGATDELCAAVWEASGGNPFYVAELLRALEIDGRSQGVVDPPALPAWAGEAIAPHLLARLRGVDPRALRLGQAVAVLGDPCELRQAAAVAGVAMTDAARLAASLVRLEILETDDPLAFLHPIVRGALDASLGTDERDSAHRSAARLLDADGAPSGRVAAHLVRVRPAGDVWVLACLLEAARTAMEEGAPDAAAALLRRALAEPPPPEGRVAVLREAARAEASAGREIACAHLEEALRLAAGGRERAEVALEVAEAYAALFRWVEAVDVLEQALAELDEPDGTLAARLEGELVVCGLHDARRASRVAPVVERLAARALTGSAAEALAVGQGMAMILAGRPAAEAARPLEEALSPADARPESWDTRAALWWSLIAAERFEAVSAALVPMLSEVQRSGSARGLVAVYSTFGLLDLRLGSLPDADAAARVALRVLQESDLAPGLAFAATVLADVAVEAGQLDEAEQLLALLPERGWPAGVGTVLIPAARGRLRLAQGRPAAALGDFETCAAMFSRELWGIAVRDVGYLHARSGAARALLLLGERERARELAQSELEDVSAFGTPRALGVALRTAGLAEGGNSGLDLLEKSADALRSSPALLERAHSLVELGAALRRSGRRAAAREPLAEGLDLAARSGARPLSRRAREELKATGARPRRDWRTGVEALTPSELRVVRLAAEGRSNREIAHQLYVTPKTVEGHLSRAYTKLGIGGRDQLSVVLPEKTGVPTP
jgi:DNA-binding CsgD family transcriptional regulator/predicted negative regulator of RcsB-dependent stress response